MECQCLAYTVTGRVNIEQQLHLFFNYDRFTIVAHYTGETWADQ